MEIHLSPEKKMFLSCFNLISNVQESRFDLIGSGEGFLSVKYQAHGIIWAISILT